jgi:hypothetical protein
VVLYQQQRGTSIIVTVKEKQNIYYWTLSWQMEILQLISSRKNLNFIPTPHLHLGFRKFVHKVYKRIIVFVCLCRCMEGRDSAVGIATGYGLDDRGVGVRIPVGSRSFTSPCIYQLWGPPNLPSKLSPKPTTQLQLVPSSRKHGSIHPLPHTPFWRSA